MRRLLSLFILLAFSTAAEAQTTRAVTFPGSSYLVNDNVTPAINRSPSGIISDWFRSTTISPGTSQVIVASRERVSGIEVLNLSIDNTVGVTGLANGNHLHLHLNDGSAGAELFDAVSDTLVPYDGSWIAVSITWDVSRFFCCNGNHGQYDVTAELRGNFGKRVVQWNPELTRGFPGNAVPFLVPYSVDGIPNRWTVAASINPGTGNPESFFRGDMAELYVSTGVGDQIAMMGIREMSGFSLRTTTGGFGPAELGPFCMGPTRSIPTICLRGGMPDFLKNMRGRIDFVVPAGYLIPTTALTDPFEIYP